MGKGGSRCEVQRQGMEEGVSGRLKMLGRIREGGNGGGDVCEVRI